MKTKSRLRKPLVTKTPLVDDVATFIASYISLPETLTLVTASWICAAWMCECWDKFPYLSVTSPEKRCGKTTLLELLSLVVPRPLSTFNISSAAMFRIVQEECPTLLLDEQQTLSRRGSEQAEVIRELLNAGIQKSAVATRVGGKDRDKVSKFSVYSPKVFAMIGGLDHILADRSLPIPLRRKMKGDSVRRFLSREVTPIGLKLHDRLEAWSNRKKDAASLLYGSLDYYDIRNDRMADLLMPLQTVLSLMNRSDDFLLEYAKSLDKRDREFDMQTPGVRLLVNCRDIFGDKEFLPTFQLLASLHGIEDEQWSRWSAGQPMNSEALSGLLRQYRIKSVRRQVTVFKKVKTVRGYIASSFQEAWNRYVP